MDSGAEYNFKKDVVDGGGYDENFVRIIQENKNLRDYFERRAPLILNGENYRVIAHVCKGEDGGILLAKEGGDKGDVFISTTDDEFDDNRIYRNLVEYMFHEQAYQVLNGKCRTTKPLGFIRQKEGFYSPTSYKMVSQHCSVEPGPWSVFTFKELIYLHSTKAIIKQCEWKNTCLSLIKAVENLQKNDIYHNAISPGNILLEVSNTKIDPLIINFCNASRGKTGNRRPMYSPRSVMQSALAPELCGGPDPLPTSDLYSVTYVILEICMALKQSTLENQISRYQSSEPDKRDTHDIVYRYVNNLFRSEISDTMDMTVEDRDPPLRGKLQLFMSLVFVCLIDY